ncbi:MAG TPA: hypothetical protein VL093_12445 [Flavipsychrobacter sp.]|jgi:hypothetical protein|nr:hypothetical protein [Flavipsychrobacter sp.]
MKRIFYSIVVCTVTMLVVAGCNKDDSSAVFNTRFYTTEQNSKLFLYLDGSYVGMLSAFSTPPTCSNENIGVQLPLTIQLRSGSYRVVGKDSTGTVVSSSIIVLGKTTTSVSGSLGGQAVFASNNCVTINVFK